MKSLMILMASLWTCSLFAKIEVPQGYNSMIEQLIYFKDDALRIFYGGPIISETGPQWIMNATFEDEYKKVRAVYELCFINCNPTKEQLFEVPVYYVQVSDIDMKFRNEASESYQIFNSFVSNTDKKKRCVVIREVDISNVYYPEIFIANIYSNFMQGDKKEIMNFLTKKYDCSPTLIELTHNDRNYQRISQTKYSGLIEQKKVTMKLHNVMEDFCVSHYYLHTDDWKSYYIITKSPIQPKDFLEDEDVLLRLDSGCVSGQIYNDEGCDCQDQLYHALSEMLASSKKHSMVIHIPTQDGRGFGSAPKLETEIYKSGGKGRINTTEAIDTIQAAILLYNTVNYDIRSFEGCADLLKRYNLNKVTLLTDNKQKVDALTRGDIVVRRQKTNTEKISCKNHIIAKKLSPLYFGD